MSGIDWVLSTARPRLTWSQPNTSIRRTEGSRWTAVVETDLAVVETAWRELEQRATGTMFQTFDWCKAWVGASKEAGAPETVRLLVLADGQRIGLLWPFAIRRLMGQRVLHSLGEPATQYSQVLISPDEDGDRMLALAWDAIRSWTDIDAVELRRVRDDSPLARFRTLAPYAVESSREGAPFVDFTRLSASGAAGQRSSKSRNALRRHEKRLAAEGEVRFRLIGKDDWAAQREVLREAFRLKAIWSAERSSVSSGYAHPASALALTKLAEDGRFCGAVLEVGGQTAAVELGVLDRGVYYSLVQSYELRLALHAPGRLLFWHLLERCPQLGIASFDFLAPKAKHKEEWSNGIMSIKDYVAPINYRGRFVVFYVGTIRPLLRKMFRRLPRSVRTSAARLQNRLA